MVEKLKDLLSDGVVIGILGLFALFINNSLNRLDKSISEVRADIQRLDGQSLKREDLDLIIKLTNTQGETNETD
ncbi:MAG: hypothetical protein GDA39_06880 [Hyphomonadaceae bacterium]|nr:hypothetical protein [Hyphomonadaceae bacterium]MBC6412609.1 hypothetical protein [Hyphomonadaceae bacterium]